jgi:DNA polymerase I-like protein with 3'-5' exonuclease and polymerase domains
MIRQNASGAMWGNDYFEIIRRDFEKAARIVRGELVMKDLQASIEEQRKNILIARSLDDVRAIVQKIISLPEGYIVSVDTETTGLDGMAEDARLLTIQFGWKDEGGVYVAGVIPLWHRENNRYKAEDAWALLVPILVSERILKVLHNAKFDILYIYHTTGVRLKGVEFDTMLMMHAISSGEQGCYSLKTAMWDWAPDLGIAGYEDLLPKLTKRKKVDGDAIEEDEDASDD